MIFAILLALVCFIALAIYGPNEAEGVALVGCVVFGLAALVSVAMVLVSHANVGPTLARIEQLRADVSKTPCVGSEDVLGQVTETNQTIREQQAYNRTWYAGSFVPDAWDGVAVISVEVCQNTGSKQ